VFSSLHTTGAYKAITELRLPDSDAEDRLSILLYHVRSFLALGQPEKALAILPDSETSIAAKAGRSLASYILDPSSTKETTLEELRDLAVEIEGEDSEADEYEKNLVRVLAGTGFAIEGEVEEALETLGAGSHHQNLEA
jgi:coatomer protein complex subunit epsilon